MTAKPDLQTKLLHVEPQTRYGTVKWFSIAKGFGFIEPWPIKNPWPTKAIEGPAKDIFVHHSALEPDGTLEIGDSVRFQLADGEKGPWARNVERI